MYNIEDKQGLYSFYPTTLPLAIYTPIYCPYSLVYRVNKAFRYTLGKTFQVIHLLDVQMYCQFCTHRYKTVK